MIVQVIHRHIYASGSWELCTPTIEIWDYCPVCFEKRNTPTIHNFCEDGEYLSVHIWKNPCGHIDYYPACLKEAQALKRLKLFLFFGFCLNHSHPEPDLLQHFNHSII